MSNDGAEGGMSRSGGVIGPAGRLGESETLFSLLSLCGGDGRPGSGARLLELNGAERPDGEIVATVRRGDGYWPAAGPADYATVTVADDDAPASPNRAGLPTVAIHGLDGELIVEGDDASFVLISDRVVPNDLRVRVRVDLWMRDNGDTDPSSLTTQVVTIPAGQRVSGPLEIAVPRGCGSAGPGVRH